MDLMEDWEKNHCNTPIMSVIDSFGRHLSDELKVELGRMNCNLVLIPGVELQPLDVLVSKLFTDY
jgi:hypothetical protein